MSTRRPTRGNTSGRVYLDLQRLARKSNRPTDEIIRLYALEAFVARITASPHAEHLVLKGGVLLAAFDVRRPTRDVDLAARQMSGEIDNVLAVIREVASLAIDDGVEFDAQAATATPIREDSSYAGVRVELGGRLSRARLALNVDVNIGDPMVPGPRSTPMPRLLGGTLSVLAHPLSMVLAEKIVTAIERRTLSTRWRDFVDIAALARATRIPSDELLESMQAVARHRQVPLIPLATCLAGYAEAAQARWIDWRRKQLLGDRTPAQFSELLAEVIAFTDPILDADTPGLSWDPVTRRWG